MTRGGGAWPARLAGLWLAVWGAPEAAWGESMAEAFLRLPDEECGGYTPAEREMMLNTAIEAPGAAGQSSVPDVNHPWVRIFSSNYLILHRPGGSDIAYKMFNGSGFQLLTVCRGRLRTAPADPACRFDLCLYRLDQAGLTRAEQKDYLPSVSILDFITADTLNDPQAVQDIAARGPTYGQCLTCNASITDQLALDVITVTTVNAAACDGFLPPFGLLPLTWNGLSFSKPYDRAAPEEGVVD